MNQTRKAWTEQEDKAIKSLVKKYGTHRWTDISKQMQDMYGLEFRSGKQCRQRWYNHLNPKINKQPWSKQEEEVLFEAHQQLGNRWKKIAERLNGRTDNSIKNHFYSTMRKKLRRINKLIGTRNSTSQVRQIKPSVLSNIFSTPTEGNQEMKEDFSSLSKQIFQFKLDKSYSRLSKNEKQKFGNIIEKINEYNDKYIQEKAQELRRPELLAKKSERKKKKSEKIEGRSEQIKQDEFEDEQKFNIDLNNFPQIPFLGRQSSIGRKSFLSNDDIIRSQMLNSPRMVTRRFIKTPSQPTPKLFAFSFSQNDVLTYDLNKNETFENELDKIQNQIRINRNRN